MSYTSPCAICFATAKWDGIDQFWSRVECNDRCGTYRIQGEEPKLLLKTLNSAQRDLISQFASRRDPNNALLYLNGYAIANLLATSNLAQIALKEYGIHDAQLTMVSEVEYHTPSFIVEQEEKRHVLRIFADDDFNQLNSEILWLGALADEGLTVPRVIPSAEGSPVIEVGADGHSPTRPCALYSWVPGVRLANIDDAARRKKLAVRFGEFLGHMHSVSAKFIPPDWFDRPSYTRQDFERNLTSHLRQDMPADQRSHLQALGQHFLDLLARCDADGAFGMVHPDLNPANIIADQDDNIGLIDFMGCMNSYFLVNLAQAVDRAVRPQEQECLLSGYSSIKALPESIAADFDTIRAVRAVPRAEIAGEY